MLRILYTGVLAIVLAAPGWSQCVLCRQAAEAYGTAGAKALNTAIIVLFAPAVAIFSMVYFSAFRGRPKDEDEGEERE